MKSTRILSILSFAASLAAFSGVSSAADQTSPLSIAADPADTNYQYYNDDSFTIAGSSYVLSISSAAVPGQSSQGIQDFTNNSGGVMTLTNGTSVAGWNTVIAMSSTGGVGLDNAYGGNGGYISIYNFAPLTANGTFASGLSIIDATSVGGTGALNSDGENGGNGGAISIQNEQSLAAGSSSNPIQGAAGFRGISALSTGGGAGESNGGFAGGNGGNITITSNEPISFYWHNTDPGTVADVYGIYGNSSGGNGYPALTEDESGGGGGSAGLVSITQSNHSITLAVDQDTSTQGVQGAVIGAFSTGGDGAAAFGANGNEISYAGKGGDAALNLTTSVTLTNASLAASGDYLGGIAAMNTGGKGGDGAVQQNASFANEGGSTGDVAVTLNETSGGIYQFSTLGTKAIGIEAGNSGGAGGTAYEYSPTFGGTGGNGGNGGNAGDTNILLEGQLRFGTNGDSSHGIVGFSRGGSGGAGGAIVAVNSYGTPGIGGVGGNAGAVTIHLADNVELSTGGSNSHGIVAQSSGGNGNSGGVLSGLGNGDAANGGNGGSTGAVSVSVEADSSVTTQGAGSIAIVAQSLSGTGGAGGTRDKGTGSNGMAGSGGNTSTITVENAGTLTTAGDNSHGIFAQGSSGAGGLAGSDYSIFYSTAQPGGPSGSVGAINITNTGAISTAGDNAYGILAMSLSGGGGDAGQTTGAIALGGSGGSAAPAGSISLTHSGSTKTSGDSSPAILLQSIGGGGGTGGDSEGSISIGGSGGEGGAGGSILASLSGGRLATNGDKATALLAQSIGGGGGNAGDAVSEGSELSLTIGGTGGSGGDGGEIEVTSSSNITTRGSSSRGILAQSVGGGGGNGGEAFSFDVGLEASVSVALGGTAGGGGDGGEVSIAANGGRIWTGRFNSKGPATNLHPTDAIGILAQSNGGGGGTGGSSVADAVAIAIPTSSGNEYTASIAYSQGGAGGGGGAGGTVELTLSDSLRLITQGQGSHGVVAQSIGGGGGSGGDSSAMAATVQYTLESTVLRGATYSADIGVTLGGKGGNGGNGELSEIEIDDNEFVKIATYGDYSNGLVAQSIGGGGGNAGIGSGTTAGFGSSKSVDATLTLGSQGGGGGDGVEASVSLGAGSSIITYGSSSFGIVAQAIGGGGGISQGGMVSLSGTYQANIISGEGKLLTDITPTGSLTVNLGATGGDGGDCEDAIVAVSGYVSTAGNDSIGVLAQAIGGGGGAAGAAGSDASADNPVVVGLEGLRAFSTAAKEGYIPFTVSGSLNLGSLNTGKSDGGYASIDMDGGEVLTQGDWAHGLVAQSIGGGGGKAGSAVATGSEAAMNLSINVGSSTGANGDGFLAQALLNNAVISTGLIDTDADQRGFSAFGILLQAIGGGGGLAADGSDSATGTITIGGYDQSGAKGNGGQVKLIGSATVSTFGEAAHGVVLQSIGGGGGIGGAGSSVQNAGPSSITLNVGGQPTASGNGGPVTVSKAVLDISTFGDNAFGLIAQSIGGGGGIGAVVDPVEGNIRAGNTQNTTGGTVNLSFNSGTSISTNGLNAIGIVAQSIGGGGGIAGYSSTSSSIAVGFRSQGDANGLGGSVVIDLAEGASITTEGDGAHGILAQSLSHGGGLYLNGGALVAGAVGGTVPGNYDSDLGGPISITIDGDISVSGENAYGIIAQSSGDVSSGYDTGEDIDITVGGSVQSSAIAIYFDGGSGNSLTIDSGGLVSGSTAIKRTGGGSVAVNNSGTLSGSVLGGRIDVDTTAAKAPAESAVQIKNFGRFYTGSLVEADVENSGVLVIGRIHEQNRFTATTLDGNLVQTDKGKLLIGADFYDRKADVLHIKGDARLNGHLVAEATALVPNVELKVLEIDGAFSGDLKVDRGGADSQIFSYMLRRDGDRFFLRASEPDFTAGLQLSPNQIAVAGHFTDIWNVGGNKKFARIFAQLDQLATTDSDAYASLLNELSPGASFGFGARRLAATRSYGSVVLNGPVFEGDTAKPSEVSATWARMYGRHAQQSVEGGFSDFTQNSAMWVVGGQTEVGHDWFLGGSAGYQYDWLGSNTVSGDGHTALAALTVKREMDSWLFSGAIVGSYSWLESERNTTVPGFQGKAEASPEIQSVGAVLRTAYTFYGDRFYFRPMVTLQTIYVHSDGYTELGNSPLALRVSEQDQTTVIGSPGFELGMRTNLAEGRIFRTYLNGEIHFASNDSWDQSARFIGAPSAAGEFNTTIPLDQVSGHVTAGVQLQVSERTSFFLQYEGEFSENLVENGGSFGVKCDF